MVNIRKKNTRDGRVIMRPNEFFYEKLKTELTNAKLQRNYRENNVDNQTDAQIIKSLRYYFINEYCKK